MEDSYRYQHLCLIFALKLSSVKVRPIHYLSLLCVYMILLKGFFFGFSGHTICHLILLSVFLSCVQVGYTDENNVNHVIFVSFQSSNISRNADVTPSGRWYKGCCSTICVSFYLAFSDGSVVSFDLLQLLSLIIVGGVMWKVDKLLRQGVILDYKCKY